MKAMKQSMTKPTKEKMAKGGAVKAKPKKYADGGIVAQMPMGPATQMPTPRMPRTPRVAQNPGMITPMPISQPKPAVMPPMNMTPAPMPRTMGGSANKMGPQAGMVSQMPMAKGGMAKGYAKGGMVNCGASVPASQKSKK